MTEVKPLIENVEKKLREAKFFLNKMIEHERVAFKDKEPFEFYLSAFLSAGRTVDYRLLHEQKAIYPTWRTAWDATLTQAHQDLIKFMVDERNVEVHESGSSHTVGTENREFEAGTHTLADGTMYVTGAPGFSQVTIPTPAYYFPIDGIERKATEACGEYLRLLEQMVADFKASRLSCTG
jgi:hypothetical protein